MNGKPKTLWASVTVSEKKMFSKGTTQCGVPADGRPDAPADFMSLGVWTSAHYTVY